MSRAVIALKRIAIFADLDTDAVEAIGRQCEWRDYFADKPGFPGSGFPGKCLRIAGKALSD